MSLTLEESALMDKRDTELTPIEQQVLKSAMGDMRDQAALYGVPLANDDRAARLEAALVRYILESRQ